MIRHLLAYALVTGCVLAVAARFAEAACRRLGLPARWIWLAALGLCTGLVATGPWHGPAAGRELAAVLAGADAARPLAPAQRARAVVAAVAGAAARPMQLAAAAASHLSDTAIRWVAAAWSTAAALLLLILATTQARAARDRRRWPNALVCGAWVHVSPRAGPAAVGLTHPAIVVPRWLLDRSDAERRLVLAHETQHARAYDPALLALGSAFAALLPWHPAAWWMLARLRLCVEVDCDRRVLRAGAAPHAYGSVLIDLARYCSGFPVGEPALAGRRTQLERRLRAMTTHPSPIARVTGAALAALALGTLVAACGQSMPTGDAAPRADAAHPNARVAVAPATEPLSAFHGLILVDGKRVPSAMLGTLDPARIARIDILKGRLAGEQYPHDTAARLGVIRVTMKPGLP